MADCDPRTQCARAGSGETQRSAAGSRSSAQRSGRGSGVANSARQRVPGSLSASDGSGKGCGAQGVWQLALSAHARLDRETSRADEDQKEEREAEQDRQLPVVASDLLVERPQCLRLVMPEVADRHRSRGKESRWAREQSDHHQKARNQLEQPRPPHRPGTHLDMDRYRQGPVEQGHRSVQCEQEADHRPEKADHRGRGGVESCIEARRGHGAGHYAQAVKLCRLRCHDSSNSVTGPSLINSTRICAPNTPFATVAPRRRSASANAVTNGSATGPAAAAFHDGRRPFSVFAYSVNWLTTRIGAFMSAADRSSSSIRKCQSFSASRRAVSSVSLWVTPTNASRPCPAGRTAPTTSSSTDTLADETRWTR